MNFLAHLLLSGDDKSIRLGNFSGDFVRGNNFSDLPEPVIQGITLHREIDRFTDSHSIVQQSKERLRPRYRHYAGVIVDIYYDHFLAVHWEDYSNLVLKEFVQMVYREFMEYKDWLPPRAQRVLPYMIAHNWLEGYGHLEGIDNVLAGMARRTRFNSGMEHAGQELRADYELYEEEFIAFFPELQEMCAAFLG